MKNYLRLFSKSSSEVFFLNSAFVGIAIFAVTLTNPNVSIAGTIAVVSAYLFARILKVHGKFFDSGFYTFNPLLVGFSAGYLFKLTLLTVFFVSSLGIITYLLTSLMYSVFSFYLRLPILSLPFVIVSSAVYYFSATFSGPFVTGLTPPGGLDAAIPLWAVGYLKSLGAILFTPEVTAGFAFALIICATSRILFALTLLGYCTGTLTAGLMAGSFEQAFLNINHFNSILIAVAVGGVFLIPSPRSYLLAVGAVVVSAVLMDTVQSFWSAYQIPIFALPFNLVSLFFIYILGVLNYPLISSYIQSTPEETLAHHLAGKRRRGVHGRTVSLPFSGEWKVWQGVNGSWTHKGLWKHAYDFIITDANGKSFHGYGKHLEDYYSLRKPVLSPVSGRIVKVVRSLPDNLIGKPDKKNNWGNLVIIEDPRGFFVELSHFFKDSMQVEKGAWVEKGQLLGRCGNSGNSSQPHIHIQVQASEEIGSGTLPFSFTGYMDGKNFHANELPKENDTISPLRVDDKLDMKTSFPMDSVLDYEVYKGSKKLDAIRWLVGKAEDGTLYLDSGKARLYFEKRVGTFHAYNVEGADPYLKMLHQALPRMPLMYGRTVKWEDCIVVDTVVGRGLKAVILFFSSFCHNLNSVQASYRFLDKNRISGSIRSRLWNINKTTLLEFDEKWGYKSIIVDDMELKKITPASN